MPREDQCEGLVVLVPMVETARKTDSVWVRNGQTKKGQRTINRKWAQYDTSFALFHFADDRSVPELTWDFWAI